VIVSGAPYGYRSDGTYESAGTTFSGAAVYQRRDQFNLLWSVYKRSYGHWVLDYNRVDDGWSGTVAYSVEPIANAWDSSSWSWHGMQIADGSSGSPPPPSPASGATSSVYVTGNLPYRSRTEGVYAPSGRTFSDAPVYTRTDLYGLTWSLYRRWNGRWIIDYNQADNTWSGTVAYSGTDGGGVRAAVWNRAITVSDVPSAYATQRGVNGVPTTLNATDIPLEVELPSGMSPGDDFRLGELHDVAARLEITSPAAEPEEPTPVETEVPAEEETPPDVDVNEEEASTTAEEEEEHHPEDNVAALQEHDVAPDSTQLLVVGAASAALVVLLVIVAVGVRIYRRNRKGEAVVAGVVVEPTSSTVQVDEMEAKDPKGITLELTVSENVSEDSEDLEIV